MSKNQFLQNQMLKRALLVGALAATVLMSGCASVYVDTATQDIQPGDIKPAAQPQPVQLKFEFQTKGAPNAAATSFLKDQVAEQVKNSGLFSSIEGQAGGALLNIVLNNIPLTDNPEGKGFVTGLTFGVAGSVVTDGYVCKLTYLPAGDGQPVNKEVLHAIHTTIGNANPPENAVPSESFEAAARTMTRQVVDNALKDLSQDPNFK
ncbi:hypothetical protein [Chitinolyticbacter albus]|uniref:hypothetical protein n=1 Tax=Chitinolyticbacter albus TaxID=2961951 RepID=UPI00210CEB19|nr:hypothetical protein [Chitinolyticbacter albus]